MEIHELHLFPTLNISQIIRESYSIHKNSLQLLRINQIFKDAFATITGITIFVVFVTFRLLYITIEPEVYVLASMVERMK